MTEASLHRITSEPRQNSYDVVIVGGAVIGSSIAWFLSANPGFDGSVLVVERDTTYANSSTAHTNSCMRQQFSNELNVRISQFAADFVRDFRSYLGDDPEVPALAVQHFGYMYLADTPEFAETLRTNVALQNSFGSATKIMSPAEIAEAYPFYNLDGIVCGSHNLVDEGYFDSGTMFDWMRKKARQSGVEYLRNEVTSVGVRNRAGGSSSGSGGGAIESVTLKTGETIRCGTLVNAAGPRAVEVATMAGLELPVEPRRRYTFIFEAQNSLDRDLPLTIDPSGVHVRSDGAAYMAGCTPDDDPAVDYDDFEMVDRDIFEEKVWPALANRIPAFEQIKVTSKWAGHYAHNTLDRNLIVGPHHEIDNFVFANGFSGHGLQQAPAVGRGVSEWIAFGEYRSLDLAPLGYRRIVENKPFIETAII